jgi:hypothetical protein
MYVVDCIRSSWSSSWIGRIGWSSRIFRPTKFNWTTSSTSSSDNICPTHPTSGTTTTTTTGSNLIFVFFFFVCCIYCHVSVKDLFVRKENMRGTQRSVFSFSYRVQ